MLQMWIHSRSKVRPLIDITIFSCSLTCPSTRPDITPTTQPPPGMPSGPGYVHPQQPQYVYQGQQQPPAGYQAGPPVASGGNQDAGHVYK